MVASFALEVVRIIQIINTYSRCYDAILVTLIPKALLHQLSTGRRTEYQVSLSLVLDASFSITAIA